MTAHVDEQLSAYLDDELDGLARQRISAHLDDCNRCSGRLAELAALDEISREAKIDAPDGYFDTLPSRIRSRLPERSAPRWVVPRWTWAAAAAALIAVVAPMAIQQGPDLAPEAPRSAPAVTSLAARPPETLAQKPDTQEEAKRQIQALDEVVAATAGDKKAEPQMLAAAPRKDAFAKSLADAPAAPPPEAAANQAAPRAKAKERAVAARKRAPAATPAAPAPAPAGFASAAVEAPAEADDIGEAEARELEEEGAASRDQDALSRTSGKVASPGRRENTDARAAVGGLTTAEALRAPTDADAVARLRLERERLRLEVRDQPDAEATDARLVRIVHIGVEIYEASSHERDRIEAEGDADAYLARGDANHQDRVRALLLRLKR